MERCEALLELFSENCSAIAQSIIDRKMKLPVNYENTIVRQWKLPLSAHEPTNCEQFNEHIRNCEEMLAKKPCEQITARLMELCNKVEIVLSRPSSTARSFPTNPMKYTWRSCSDSFPCVVRKQPTNPAYFPIVSRSKRKPSTISSTISARSPALALTCSSWPELFH